MPCLTPFEVKIYDKETDQFLGYRKVPCGKCPDCLSRKRSAWSYRLWFEFLNSESAWFVTLTYDTDHLPLEGVNKSDVQKFFKRFRKKYGDVRYFLVSEYGDKHGRPHYHAILFFPKMVELPDITRAVDTSWQNGNIMIGNVTLASINYCSKYSLKSRYDEDNIFPNKTFSLMSRRPGIGACKLKDKYYVDSHRKDLDTTGNIDGFTYNLPRYFRDKIFNKIDKIKINAKIQEIYGNKEHKDNREDGQRFIESYKHSLSRCRTR